MNDNNVPAVRLNYIDGLWSRRNIDSRLYLLRRSHYPKVYIHCAAHRI